MAAASNPHSPDQDTPVSPNLHLAQFAAGCFWGVELAFQRVHGVVLTEVGYTQGHLPDPTYERVYNDDTGHVEAVRVHFDPNVCSYEDLLRVFWGKHDPTTLNRQGEDVGTRYRSGIYYYNDAQEKAAKESLETKQQEVDGSKIVTQILATKKFYQAEKLHQQYLENGGGYGNKQSAAKGCTDPIRCYG